MNTAIKFGIALPYGSARMAANLAQLAEQAGWEGCFMGDAIWCEDPMIGLAAAAMVTQRIRLGTLIIPAPLRKPWKIASEVIALEHLSGGRMTIGIGAGAAWMGWQAFPDEVTGARERAEMLDETIDILSLLFERKPFDYDGRHFHLKLTLLNEDYYPPKPIQQPRIPIWTPGLWPRQKSMQRALRCDGLLVEKVNDKGAGETATPEDVRDIAKYVQENRIAESPFDIVVSGQTGAMEAGERRETTQAWQEAGATWWIETCYGDSEAQAAERIRQGPPA